MNKPSIEVDKLKEDIASRLIMTGILHLRIEVEIQLGIITKDSIGYNCCQPIYLYIILLHVEINQLQFAISSGLIDIGIKIDLTLCHINCLASQVLSMFSKLPQIFTNISITYLLLEKKNILTVEKEK